MHLPCRKPQPIAVAIAEKTPASHHFIRVSLGLIYFHFGFLKFYADLSPAEVLAGYTSQILVSYELDAATVLRIVAILECAIGVGFLFGIFMRTVAVLFTFHMIATFLPLFVLPEFAFKFAPFAFTIEGQYIIKNLVLVTAGWAVLAPHFRRRGHDPVPSAPESPQAPDRTHTLV